MAWHHENFSPLRNSQAGRDQRPGAMARFDNHNPLAKPTHNAVSCRKVVGAGAHGGGELAHHSPLLKNRLGKWTVSRRVDASMATSEHC